MLFPLPCWQSEDGTYTGFIKVHLKLRRPVTVPAGIRPQSIYDAIKEVNLAATTDKRTSFYLPLDAIKQLHISSTTTVSEVIQGLLKKFMVVDNPQKFALFKRIHKDGQGTGGREARKEGGLSTREGLCPLQPLRSLLTLAGSGGSDSSCSPGAQVALGPVMEPLKDSGQWRGDESRELGRGSSLPPASPGSLTVLDFREATPRLPISCHPGGRAPPHHS